MAKGASLSQIKDSVKRPISFGSRHLNKAERNYSASELELLALVWSMRHRCYLYGKCFLVRNDNAVLRYLHRFSDNNSRLVRWSLRLAEFDFWVDHCPVIKILHADDLSRSFQTVTTENVLSKEVICRQQMNNPFCKSLKVKTAGACVEYFYDQNGVIYKRQTQGEPLLIM
jgi:hypothetical protein